MRSSLAESLDRLLVMLETQKYEYDEPPAVCPVCDNGMVVTLEERDDNGLIVKGRAAKPCRSELHKSVRTVSPEGARFS